MCFIGIHIYRGYTRENTDGDEEVRGLGARQPLQSAMRQDGRAYTRCGSGIQRAGGSGTQTQTAAGLGADREAIVKVNSLSI